MATEKIENAEVETAKVENAEVEEEGVPAIDEKEFAVAQKVAKDSSDAFTYRFSDPFTYEDKTYTSLTFDFSTLAGNDSIEIEDELMALNQAVIVPEMNARFLIRLAARACTVTIGADVLCALPLGAFNKIRGAARSFCFARRNWQPCRLGAT